MNVASDRQRDAHAFPELLRQAAEDMNFLNRAILTDLWWEDKVRYELAVAQAQTIMRNAITVAEMTRRRLEQLEQNERWNRPFPELPAE